MSSAKNSNIFRWELAHKRNVLEFLIGRMSVNESANGSCVLHGVNYYIKKGESYDKTSIV